MGDEREPLPNPPVHEREPAPVQATPNEPRHSNPSPPANGTPPATGTRPTPPPSNGQPNGPNLGSIGDALSGLLGSIGSGSASGGGDRGSDGGFNGTPAAEPQPAAAAASTANVTADSAKSEDKKDMDVELTDVRLVDAGNLEQKTGPRFRLTYRNKGTVEAPKFNVTVAVDATMKLTETAEMITVEAVGLKPGKTQTVDVRLPVEVLSIGTAKDGKPAPFALLVAILDSDESLDETDEENNVLVFARDEIKSVKN